MARRIDGVGVIEALAQAMCLHGIPDNIRCDDAPGSPWENGYCESLNGKTQDE